MKIFFNCCLLVAFFLSPLSLKADPPFQGVSVEEENNTEAYFNDGSSNSEFCCDRELSSDWAQDLSEQESKRIVNRVLYSQDSKPPSPSPGQR